MKKPTENKIRKAIDLFIHHSTFRFEDVVLLLKMPFKEDLDCLLALINFNEREKLILQYYFFDNKNINETADLLGLSEKHIDRCVLEVKEKCYKVWQINKEANMLLNFIKSDNIINTFTKS